MICEARGMIEEQVVFILICLVHLAKIVVMPELCILPRSCVSCLNFSYHFLSRCYS